MQQNRTSIYIFTQVIREFNVQLGWIHIGANVFGTDVYDRISLHGPNLGTTEKFREMKYR